MGGKQEKKEREKRRKERIKKEKMDTDGMTSVKTEVKAEDTDAPAAEPLDAQKDAEQNVILAEKERKAKGSVTIRDDNEPFFSFCEDRYRPTLDILQEFYGFTNGFNWGNIMCRSEQRPKSIYYVPDVLVRIVSRPENRKFRLIYSGIRTFASQRSKNPDHKCLWRITHEAIPLLLPYMGGQVVNANLEDYTKLEDKRSDEMGIKASAVSAWMGKNGITLLVGKENMKYLYHKLTQIYGVETPDLDALNSNKMSKKARQKARKRQARIDKKNAKQKNGNTDTKMEDVKVEVPVNTGGFKAGVG